MARSLQEAAGWFADPVGRHDQRWWNGREWTDQVADGQVVAHDATTARCPKGHPAPPGSAFCPECGSPIVNVVSPVVGPAVASAPQAPLVTHGSEAARLQASLTPCLEAGEQLRAVAQFQSGGNPLDLPNRTYFTMRDWAVGVTDRRVILAKQSRLNANHLLDDSIFSVPREDVVVRWRTLYVTSPDPKVPRVLKPVIGSGYRKKEFEQALRA